jgi:hypothetical protein
MSLFGYKIPWGVAFFSSLVYVFLLRQGGFQGDFATYLEELRSGWTSFYYLREPFFWVGSKFLFSLINDQRIVISIYDFIFCFSLYKAVRKVTGVQVFLILLVSFPIFLGLENVYRQVLGLPFSFFFIYYCLRGRLVLSLFYLLVASLFHNSYLILFPILVLFIPRISIRFGFCFFIISFSVFILVLKYFGLSVADAGKSTAQVTGLNLAYLYLFVIIFNSVFLKFFVVNFKREWIFINLQIIILYTMLVDMLGSAQSERSGMIFLLAQFFVFFCFSGVNMRGPNNVVKAEMFFLLAFPVFLFSSTRSFLFFGSY